jgi:hypothetical protein
VNSASVSTWLLCTNGMSNGIMSAAIDGARSAQALLEQGIAG